MSGKSDCVCADAILSHRGFRPNSEPGMGAGLMMSGGG